MFNKKKEYIDKIKKEYEIVKDEEGRSLIEIKVDNKDSVLSSFSTKEAIISNELAEFINHQLRPMTLTNGIHLNLICDDITDEEKKIYDSAIRNYYKHELIEKNRELTRNKVLVWVMGILGTIILAVSILLNVLERLTVFASVIDIVAWVLLWEAVDLHIFQRPKIEIEELRAYEIANSIITYNEIKVD